MRNEKIRGHSRRHKQIDKWRHQNLTLNFSLLKKYDREYAEIVVHPWCDISIIKSAIPNPTRKTKRLILTGLLDIYDSWKKQLDELEQPYYLKIWLFEPRFSQSQVVCAVKDKIDYYENNFYRPELPKTINLDNYGALKQRLKKLSWDYRLDENYYDNTEVGEPKSYASKKDHQVARKWFAKLLKKPHRTDKLSVPIGDITETYSFKRGDLWLGGEN